MPKRFDKTQHRRINLIDEIRGFCVLCMVVFHAGYDLYYIFNAEWIGGFIQLTEHLVPAFAGTFILISGFCCCLSRSNLKRGAQLLLIALAINYITLIFIPDETILFGILNLLSISMLICGVFEKQIMKLNRYAAIAVLFVLFIQFYNMENGYIGIRGIFTLNIPWRIADCYDLYPIGIVAPPFYSSDYFPLLPWSLLFFIGVNLGRFAAEGKIPQFCFCSHIKPLAFLGRHALIIYILHQPIIYAILYIVFLIV